MMKWLVLVVGFLLCFLALEVYRNTALMDRGYLLQNLRARKKVLIEKHGHLQEKLSSHLSLNRLEDYAREELGLVNPEKVRFLKEYFSPPKRSSSPPPLRAQVETRLKSWFLEIIQHVNTWFNLPYEEKT